MTRQPSRRSRARISRRAPRRSSPREISPALASCHQQPARFAPDASRSRPAPSARQPARDTTANGQPEPPETGAGADERRQAAPPATRTDRRTESRTVSAWRRDRRRRRADRDRDGDGSGSGDFLRRIFSSPLATRCNSLFTRKNTSPLQIYNLLYICNGLCFCKISARADGIFRTASRPAPYFRALTAHYRAQNARRGGFLTRAAPFSRSKTGSTPFQPLVQCRNSPSSASPHRMRLS